MRYVTEELYAIACPLFSTWSIASTWAKKTGLALPSQNKRALFIQEEDARVVNLKKKG